MTLLSVRAAILLKKTVNASFSSVFQALNDAKRELRYLLVYLHGEDHQDTDEFCRFELGVLYVLIGIVYSGTHCEFTLFLFLQSPP